MKSLVNDLVVTCDEIVDTPESASINPNDEISYRLVAVLLLPIECLRMFVTTIVKCYETWINNSMIIIALL